MDNDTKQIVDSISGLLASSWKAGNDSRVEQFLHDSTDFGKLSIGEQREAVISLLQMEIEMRRDSGQSLNVSELVERFPRLDREDIESLIAAPALPPIAGGPSLPDRFEMLEEVGRGGIGAVWRVTDQRMDRQLAIKLLLPHFRRNQQANERLKRESLLTGSLQHPGIPPVHEFGTMADGAVYFSMKLVEGQTLASMLANRKSAADDLPAMLNVFEQVAQTMAYAHEQYVIHRDLKPHNIMVGRFGEVQVMDWGMAKRLDENHEALEYAARPNVDETRPESLTPTITNHADATPNLSMDSSLVDPLISLTQAGDVLGTPAYMAPEQARGEIAALSPASDVFGLGAMLFELLTGSRLYESPDGTQQVLTMAAAGAVGLPLKKLEALDVDPRLVELCRRCLHPEMAQRLPTASHVADEVTGYLEGVQQRLKQAELDRRSAEVRVAEERKRRRLAIFLSGTIAAAVLAGLLGVLWQRNAAIASAKNAEKSAKGYSDVLDIVEKSFESVNPSQGADAKMPARDVLLNAFENLKQSDLDDEGRIVLLTKLSTCFLTIGEYKVAIPCAKANVELTTAKLGPDHPTTMLAVNNLGAIYAKAGMAKEAAPLLEKTLAQRTAQLGEDHPDTLTSQEDLASCYIVAERFDDAVKLLEIVLEARRDIKGLDDPETRSTMDSLALAYQDASDTDIDSLNSINNLLAAYITSGQHLKALRMWEKTLENFENTAGENHPITLMFSHNMVVALVKAGYAQEGVILGEKTVKGRIEKLGADHPDTLQSMNNLAQAYERVGDFEKAVDLYQRTVDGYTQKLGATDTNTLIPVIGLGNALRQAGRTDEAIDVLEKHTEITKQAFGLDHHIAITCVNNLASAYSDAGQNQNAIRLGNEVVELRKAKQGLRDRGTLISMNNLATFQMRAGMPEAAAELIKQAYEIALELYGPSHQDTLYFSNNLSEATRRNGKFDEARNLYEKTLAGQKTALGEEHPDTLRTINGLAHTLHQLGQLEESMNLYRQTLKTRRKKLGDDHPDTLYSMHGIAGVARDAGQTAAALKIFQRTLVGRQSRLGKNHPRTVETLYQLTRLLLNSKPSKLNSDLLSSLREACEKHPDQRYVNGLAMAEYRATNYQAAIDAIKSNESDEKEFVGADSLGILALSHQKLGDSKKAKFYYEQFIQSQDSRSRGEFPKLRKEVEAVISRNL